MDLRVRLDHVDFVLEVNRAVTLDLKLLGVRLADFAGTAHIDEFWEELILARVDHGEGVYRDQDLVAVTVDSHRVIVVLVFIHGWSELNVDVLCDACRNHALLLVTNFEVLGLRWQNVEALWGGRIVNQSQFHRVRFICLEAGKLNDAWRGTEDSI